jgi:hypothetical protein
VNNNLADAEGLQLHQIIRLPSPASRKFKYVLLLKLVVAISEVVDQLPLVSIQSIDLKFSLWQSPILA